MVPPMLRRLGIEPGELRPFAWAAATLFLLGWADVSVKNASEAVFNKRVGVQYMPVAFLLSSVLLVGTTYVMAGLATRSERLRLLPRTLLGLAVLLLPLWWLLDGEHVVGSALPLLVSKQIPSIALMVFLLTLGDLFHQRQTKRLLAPLMAGMTLGFMLGSFASDPLADRLGVEGLLPFSAGVLTLSALMSLPLRRGGRARIRVDDDETEEPAAPLPVSKDGSISVGRLWRENQLFRLLALLTIGNAVLGPMLYFQFQYVADLATAGSDGENQLLSIYSQFRGWISLGILFTQLGLASSLFRRIGLPLAATISPVVYLLGFTGLSIQLSLTAGVGALAGTKLVDQAVFDPALRVLYSLFSERIRARAGALLEGPIKRAGGAFGNLVTQAIISLGSTGWVGYLALPIAAAWTCVAFLLWRSYPILLLRAASTRGARGFDRLPVQDLLDRTTERVLAQRLADPDPEVCRVAMDLCAEADPQRAVVGFAQAARNAPPETRKLLVNGLDRLLEAAVKTPISSRSAAEDLEALLEAEEGVAGLDRANVVQAYGRLTLADPDDPDRARLERFADENTSGVRLAALAALSRRGAIDPDTLDRELAQALHGEETDARHIALEELRAFLVQTSEHQVGPRFEGRLALLTGVLDDPASGAPERAAAAEGLADVARRHGERVAKAAEAVLVHWNDADPRVRAAAVTCAGHAGIEERARAIVERVGDPDDAIAAAAREAVLALGPVAAEVLLIELSYGRRSRREAILRLVREMEFDKTTLRKLYGRELDDLRQTLLHRASLEESEASPLLVQRLDERLEEGGHAALQILAAVHDRESIAQVGQQMRRNRDPRRRAILVEALEAVIEPEEKRALLPLLEDRPLASRAEATAQSLGTPVPPADLALRTLRRDRDELTRLLACGTTDDDGRPLAAGRELADATTMLEPVEIATYLRKTPLFESLATRHLVEIAGVVREEQYPANTMLFDSGESGTTMYLIVDGQIRITRGEHEMGVLGPEEFFGEVGLLEGVERSAAATAMTRVRLLSLERDDLLLLMEELPAIAIGVAQELSRRLRQTVSRLDDPS